LALLSGWVKVADQTDPRKCIHPDRLQFCWEQASTIQIETNDAQGYSLFTVVGQGSGGYEGLVIRLQMERSNSNQ